MRNKAKIIIFILLVLTYVFTNFSFGGKNGEEIKVNIKDRIPLEINAYIGKEQEIPEKVFNHINPEEILMRKYKKDGREINLAVVISDDRDDLHAPEVCYKLQGFVFEEEKDEEISSGCKITKIFTNREEKPYIFHVWYTDMETVYKNRLELIKNIVLHKIKGETGKKYGLVIAFTEESNVEQLKLFSREVNNFILKKNSNLK